MARVTREELRAMQPGQTKVFDLADARACDSGKATVYQMQNLLRCKFSVDTDYVSNRLSVTRL